MVLSQIALTKEHPMSRWKQKLIKRADAIKREIWAISLAMKDPRTPWTLKLLAGMIIAYALSPLDLIPDFIPMLGWLDDLLLLPLAIGFLLRALPIEVLSDCRIVAAKMPNVPMLHGRLVILFVFSVWAATIFATYKTISLLPNSQ